ncbi:MAG: FMN-binding protein [Planctomycetaceae bacterium]|nr:FMN-binding protein [Planctomycetaceae bacterium]
MPESLPILSDAVGGPPAVRTRRPWRALLLHGLRIAVLVAIILLVHRNHVWRMAAAASGPAKAVPIELTREYFAAAHGVTVDGAGETIVMAEDGSRLGTLLQTSPQADHIVGFSGPTNVLVALGSDEQIVGVRILSSRDTDEHARQVGEHPSFLPSYFGLSRSEAASLQRIDGVAGATLTSSAIAEAIAYRLGGVQRSLRFPEGLAAEEVTPLFKEAVALRQDAEHPGLWHVFDAGGAGLGVVLRGSPAVDNIIGYQGPTDVLLRIEPTGPELTVDGEQSSATANATVTGVALGRTWDNEGAPGSDNETDYVGYVREDRYFLKKFTGRTVSELAAMDLKAERIEGVSGATMTSMAVAEGLIAAARAQVDAEERLATAREAARFRLSPRDVGTGIVALVGVVIACSSWRGRWWIRIPWLLTLVIYLGFTNGDLVSQALVVGWAQTGVPWRTMCGMLLLIAVAFIVPVAAERNVYCSHLCPHGAAQQLLMSRLPWRWKLGRFGHRFLTSVPALLLLWVVFVAATGAAFSLVDIEPFDAYVPLIAGVPALVIFGFGLIVSLFLPMAYCQYGCPTGALLGWLRRHPRSDDLGWGDLIAVIALLIAAAT